MKKIILLMAALSAGSASASGGLVLNVDTTNKEFWLTGSASGDPANVYFFGFDSMLFATNESWGGDMNILNNTFLVTSTPDSANNGSFNTIQIDFSHGSFKLEAGWNTTVGLQNVTGNGTHYSYASFNAGNITYFEALAGADTVVSQFHGDVGFGTLTVSAVSAIPEPSTYAALFGAAALGLAAWRRRQRGMA